MPSSFEDFVNLAFQSAKAKQQITAPEEETELTEEELAKIRAIREKLKKQS
jgi:hypothetical protein